ncbi:MAG TPA: hypothetical protein VIN04_14305 [Myxococcota bacterium]
MRIPAAACLLALLALSCSVAAGAARAADERFLPLGAGAVWEYTLHRDHTYRAEQGHVDRTFREGRVLLEHVRALEGGVHELRERRDEHPLGPGLPPSRERTLQRWSAAHGVTLHAFGPVGGELADFAPPLRMLPADPGRERRWTVGAWRAGGVSGRLAGELLGREDVVEGTLRFEDCLKVRYAGPIEGAIQVAGGLATLHEARLERLVWWKAGVGPVRETFTIEGGLRLPDGARARVHEVATLRLARHEPPR